MSHKLYKLVAPNGKSYIGVTSRSVEDRLAQHVKSESAIGNALRKYGVESFLVVTVESDLSEDNAFRMEQELVESDMTLSPNGYNLVGGGRGGRVMSQETRYKIGNALLGVSLSVAHCEAMSRGLTGKKRTVETKRKMSLAAKARRGTLSDETRRKMSASAKGRKFSAETRRKNSEAQKARWEAMPEERKRKICESLKAHVPKKHSEESKIRMSEAQKERYVTRGTRRHTEESKRKISKTLKVSHAARKNRLSLSVNQENNSQE